MSHLLINRRNAKVHDFDIESLNVNVESILAMDVAALQAELKRGSVTSV